MTTIGIAAIMMAVIEAAAIARAMTTATAIATAIVTAIAIATATTTAIVIVIATATATTINATNDMSPSGSTRVKVGIPSGKVTRNGSNMKRKIVAMRNIVVFVIMIIASLRPHMFLTSMPKRPVANREATWLTLMTPTSWRLFVPPTSAVVPSVSLG